MDMKVPPAALTRRSAKPGHGPGHGRSIGQILVESGVLDEAAAVRIAQVQREQGLRFGEAAVQLKLLTLGDIEYALARQFEYPYLSPTDGSVAPEVVSAFSPFGPLAEQMRSLRTRLTIQLASRPSTPRTVALVSAMPGEGRSFVAANLAVAFSQMGERTLLIDADLRQPSQHRLFNLPGRMGLSNVLLGRSGPECIVKLPHFFDLSVLTAGSTPPNPQELLIRTRLSSLLAEAAEQYDIVVVDTPAVSRYADAQVIAARVGASVLVTREGLTDARVLGRAMTSLKECGAELIGTVLNHR